ncbi:unnamed protein product, partial [Rangifer tarandus platyrhynchus]
MGPLWDLGPEPQGSWPGCLRAGQPPRGSGLGSETRLWDGEGIWTHLFVISGVRAREWNRETQPTEEQRLNGEISNTAWSYSDSGRLRKPPDCSCAYSGTPEMCT